MPVEAPQQLPKSVRKTLDRAEKRLGIEQDKRTKENETNKAVFEAVRLGMNLAINRSKLTVSEEAGRIRNHKFEPISLGNLSLDIEFTYEGEVRQDKPTLGSSTLTISASDVDSPIKTTLFIIQGNYPNFLADGEYAIEGGKGKKKKRAREAVDLLNVMAEVAASEPKPRARRRSAA